MSCEKCKYKRTYTTAEAQKPEPVPGHAFEVTVTAFQATIRKLIAVIIIIAVLLVGTNVAWVIYESQFETISSDEYVEAHQEAEGGGSNYAVNGDFYGEADG